MMVYPEISKLALDSVFEVHRELGPGLLELHGCFVAGTFLVLRFCGTTLGPSSKSQICDQAGSNSRCTAYSTSDHSGYNISFSSFSFTFIKDGRDVIAPAASRRGDP
jgi:hypothetical protein